MKASILLKEFNCENCVEYVTNSLSKIKDIFNIVPDKKASKVSFVYKSEIAVLEAVAILGTVRKMGKEFNQGLKIA